MAERQIERIRKDFDGDIIKVGNYKSEDWSPRDVKDVISDIISKLHSYYVHEEGEKAYVHVVDNRYIRTNADTSPGNNLDNLPNDL